MVGEPQRAGCLGGALLLKDIDACPLASGIFCHRAVEQRDVQRIIRLTGFAQVKPTTSAVGNGITAHRAVDELDIKDLVGGCNRVYTDLFCTPVTG